MCCARNVAYSLLRNDDESCMGHGGRKEMGNEAVECYSRTGGWRWSTRDQTPECRDLIDHPPPPLLRLLPALCHGLGPRSPAGQGVGGPAVSCNQANTLASEPKRSFLSSSRRVGSEVTVRFAKLHTSFSRRLRNIVIRDTRFSVRSESCRKGLVLVLCSVCFTVQVAPQVGENTF